MVVQTVSKTMTKIFGSRNERLLKGYHKRVAVINELEPQVRKLTDAELREKTQELRDRIASGQRAGQVLPEAMAVGREVMDRSVGIRNILDPAQQFDPSRLSEQGRKLYEQVKAEADATEPIKVLGSAQPVPDWMKDQQAAAEQVDVPVPGWMQVEIPVALYDAVRQMQPTSRPPFRCRPFDVQLIGGMVLGEGRIAEMKTGEGKTIVAPLACYVACLEQLQCHVVTVNSYLVQRDRDWVFPFYYWLGLTVGAIHPMHAQPPQKKAEAYQCDVLYGTNSELGFDYLRDNMKLSTGEQVQTRRDFCIVDEIDSILIDEARTPLIISGPAHTDAPRYDLADQIARHLIQAQRDWDAADQKVKAAQRKLKGLEGDIRNSRDKAKTAQMKEEQKRLEQELPRLEAERDQYKQYYEIEMERKAAHLTHDGVAEAQKKAGIGSFYVGNNIDFPHLLENALRAHVVYKRDKDYVVHNGEVVIVDEFTGRLMVGRQWSDGLHQAVECKEGVKIKEETQTLATVTIQNFFKLYKRLAGMTGTAITEATEFNEIYDLEVVAIPTNLPIARVDREDLIFLSEKDKWDSIVDEIKRVHDLGRPVLVGTTSVERSEMLSAMLTKKHGIKHAVLNAKAENAEREGNMVENAGSLGAVMIATNMAGRGTDIKLQPVDRAALVDHWKRRDILPADARPQMSDDELIALSYRHQAIQTLGISKKEAADLSDEQLKLRLLRHWVVQDAWVEESKAQSMSLQQCMETLDKLPDYLNHRLGVWDHVEKMGGLHIVGTERHESRRIDNQLRGRAGRQGDKGSSRFFLSLEDDLMKMFAGKATMTALSKLGMKEGDAIEHRWVSRSVERAQRKVEERNYEIRKNLLEYDEVMEHQRNAFYSTRQQVLEGHHITPLIFEYIEDSVAEAVGTYLAKDYTQTQVAEWVRHTLDVSIDPSKLHLESFDELSRIIRKNAASEIQQVVEVTLGEYMSDDLSPEEWDLRGLQQWAMSRFDVDLKQNQVRQMNVAEVQQTLTDAALEQVEKKDLSGVSKFLEPHYAGRQLAEWVKQKFDVEPDPAELEQQTPEEATERIVEQARAAYQQRELTYPVEFIMDVVMQGAQQNQQWALDQLIGFVKQRYELDWSPQDIDGKTPRQIYDTLVEQQKAWLRDGRLEAQAKEKAEQFADDPKGLAHWLRNRFGVEMTPDQIEQTEDKAELIVEKGRESFRGELTRLERFVLLQILDQAWKDHLYAMDQLKDSIGLRGYAEKDPKIEYKREGANHFRSMQSTVRDRVTELIFRARLTPNVQVRSAYGSQQQAQHAQAPAAVGAPGNRAPGDGAANQNAAAAQEAGTSVQREDLAAADRAGSRGGDRPMTRKQRRAQQARARHSGGGKQKSRKRKSR